MKKVFLGILVLFFLGNVANSQGLAIGVKGGYMYSAMDTKNVRTFQEAKASAKSGYMLGAFARIGEKFFFQPELQYRVRTSDFKLLDIASNKTEFDVKYKTLDAPLLLGLRILKLPIISITAHAGPVASLKIDNETTLKEEISHLGIEQIKDYKSFVWSGQVGVTIDIASFVLDLSYEKGMSDISHSKIGKNDLFFATLGFKLY